MMLRIRKVVSLALVLFFSLGLILPSINVGQVEAAELPNGTKLTYQKLKETANIVLDKISTLGDGTKEAALIVLELKLTDSDDDNNNGIDDGIDWLSDKIGTLDPNDPPLDLKKSQVERIIEEFDERGIELDEAARAVKLLTIWKVEDREELIDKLTTGDTDNLFEEIDDQDFVDKLRRDFDGISELLPAGYDSIEELSFIAYVAKYAAEGPIFTDDGDSVKLKQDNQRLNEVKEKMDQLLDGIDTIYGKYDTGDADKVLGLFEGFLQDCITEGGYNSNSIKTVLETYGLYEPAPKSDNADLASLGVSTGTLNPAFNSQVTSYRVTVSSSTENITITPTASDTKATIKVNNVAVNSGQATNPIALNTGDNTVTITVTAEDGSTKTYTIKVVRPTPIVVEEGEEEVEIDVDDTTKDLELPDLTEEDAEKVTVKLDIPKEVEDVTIKVSGTKPAGNNKIEATLPKLEVKATRTINNSEAQIELTIPAGTKVTAPENWDGTIKLPKVVANSSVEVPNADRVDAVIEVGLDEGNLEFEKAVRILLPGQAGKSAGAIRGNTFTKIDYTLSADDQEAADRELTGNRIDGKVDAGSNLAIWTKHFTKFVSYVPETGGGPGGGGGGAPIPAKEGTVTVSAEAKKAALLDGNVVLDILAGTFADSTTITVKKVKEADITLPVAKPNAKFMLAGEIYEFDAEGKAFNKPITVAIKFDPVKLSGITGEELKKLGVYRYNETSKHWDYVGGKVDTANGTVTVSLDSFSKYTVLYYDRTFVDIQGHWAQKDIELMAARHIAAGMTDTQYIPEANLTRAQFAALLARVVGLQEVPVTTSQFTDVAVDAWYAGTIQAAYEAGLIAGVSATEFAPEANITREQMAALIMRAYSKLTGLELEKIIPAGTTKFTDLNQVSDWARHSVLVANQFKIMGGMTETTIEPQGNATRAQGIVMIKRLLEVTAKL